MLVFRRVKRPSSFPFSFAQQELCGIPARKKIMSINTFYFYHVSGFRLTLLILQLQVPNKLLFHLLIIPIDFHKFHPFQVTTCTPSTPRLEIVNVHELLPTGADHHDTALGRRIIVQGETYHAEVAKVRHVEIPCLGVVGMIRGLVLVIFCCFFIRHPYTTTFPKKLKVTPYPQLLNKNIISHIQKNSPFTLFFQTKKNTSRSVIS